MSRTTMLTIYAGLQLVVSGCSNGPLELVPVSGSVKYSDGTIPEGAVRVVRFEPVADAEGTTSPRAAAGYLNADGSFELMTMRPRDGAVPGDYKPALLFWKSADTRETVIPPAYCKAATTPLATMSVRSGGHNHFDLVIERQ